MHGHARVELRDADTGRLEDVREHDNLVTDAVRDIVTLEACASSTWDGSGMGVSATFATSLLGGLAMFDKELEEDASNTDWPSDAHLVGCAGNFTNTSDPMLGSINSIESGPITGGYRTVWDFGTSQANGTIRSLARMSAGSDRRIHYTANIPFPRYVDDRGYYYWSNRSLMLLPVHPRGPIGVYESASAAKPTGILAEQDLELSFEDGGTRYSTTDYTLADGLDGYLYAYATSFNYTGSDGGSYWKRFNDRVAYRRVKMSDASYDVGDVQVVKWSIDDLGESGYSDYWSVSMLGGYVWLYLSSSSRGTSKTEVYRIPVSNPAAAERVDVSAATKESGVGKYMFLVPMRGGSARIGIEYSNNGWRDYVIASDLKLYRCPLNSNSRLSLTSMPHIVVDESSSYSNVAIDGLYLGTIDNVGEVTKNPSQTMKVIYDLTDE